MEEKNRLDFLVYYRRQLQLIIGKLDRQIEKLGGKSEVEDNSLLEDDKNLLNSEFLEGYVDNSGVIETLNECRNCLKSFSESEDPKDDRLYYSSSKHGNRFAMIAISPKHVNMYISPNLGVYDKIPDELRSEIRFGKSQGDRWDKFQLTTPYQAKKAVSYLKTLLAGNNNEAAQ